MAIETQKNKDKIASISLSEEAFYDLIAEVLKW